MDRLLSMEVFVAVVDKGSFTAASEVFSISPPMVGKHIHFLEQRLGARLLTRTTRRQSLTEIGRQYYERCKQILAEIHAAESGAEAMRAIPRGKLRINAPVSFGSLRVAPALTDYLEAHPEVSLELTLNDRIVDLLEEGYDAAIRIGELAESSLIARRLASYPVLICAAPAYLARAGVPTTPEQLVGHQCLGFTHWRKRGGWQLDRDVSPAALPFTRFQSNNGQALRMAALRGFGIVMQPELLLADDVAAGRLVTLLSDYRPAPRPVHLVYPRDRQSVPKLTTVIDFIVQRFG